MLPATLISASEYLETTFRPDRDYVDGEAVERNMGEWDHSRLQALLLRQLFPFEDSLGLLTAPEQRVQVKPNRFRVPDLCVVPGNPGEQVLTTPPLLCIEILSPEDSMSSMQERIDDYVQFGVENIWILDPRRRKAYWADRNGVHEFVDGWLATSAPEIAIDLNRVWP